MDPEQIAAMDPEGDFTKRHLLNPTVLQMLGDVSGRKVLDAGSGQGYFSRMLARLGATVTSMEPADALFRHSLRMEAHDPLGIEYVQEDLTSTSIPPAFDIVVCNMVLISIQEWEVALAACSGALRPGGTLVLSLQHPCFETAESVDLPNDPHLVLRDYLTERPLSRPVATDFHRTLSTYVNTIVQEGLFITGLAEPGLSEEGATEPGAPKQARLLQHVPNFLVIRAERPA
jgi:2-polyprenyl-3-methyl-5-hydroxy-6-metoxy-1,4-benzoquinol methylase